MAIPTTQPEILKYLATFKGTVAPAWVRENPSLAPFEGMTAVQMYRALAKANPSAAPLTLGQAVTETWIGGGLSGVLSGLVTGLGAATAASAAGTVGGLDQFATSNPLGQIGAFLGTLSQGALWIRVGEAVLGIILIAVGLAKLTSAVPAATKIAKAVA